MEYIYAAALQSVRGFLAGFSLGRIVSPEIKKCSIDSSDDSASFDVCVMNGQANGVLVL